MHRWKVMMALLLLTLCGVPPAGAAGVGTFSIEGSTTGFGVNQFGLATLYLDSTWDPRADDVFLYVTWDPNVVQYVSTDWKVGNSKAATLTSPGELFLQFADWTNQFPSGRIAIADINFKGLAPGRTSLDLRVDHVRSHVGASPTNFVDLTPSAITTSGSLTVGGEGSVPTTPVPTTATPLPTTMTVPPTEPPLTPGTSLPTAISTEVTTPVTAVPTESTTPTPSPSEVPTWSAPTSVPSSIPIAGAGGGSEDYTGVRTATPTVRTTVTVNATTATATPTTTTETKVTEVVTVPPTVATTPTEVEPVTMTPRETVPPPLTTVPATMPPTTAPTRAAPGLLIPLAGLLIALATAGSRR